MSPRSEELLASSRRWLESARASLASGFAESALADAYYAALYAARAALSEEQRYAKTHSGIWTLFGELFVATDRIERETYRRVRRLEEMRIDVHYEAGGMSADESRAAVTTVEAFIEDVSHMLREGE